MPNETKTNRLIHIGILKKKGKEHYCFLREQNPILYEWKEEENGNEKSLNLFGSSIEEAIFKIRRAFDSQEFCFLDCGFRYTLPERDEHGINALFFQMKESYNASNGVYFDEILGNNCHVQFASLDALKLLKKLQLENRL
ncbi:MAG TPA: hypothetical protein PLC42_03490 [Parachlamydiaceae bacterium]|nr:hypothetical protein [Parachlamydiaceae bacterium]